MDKAVQLRAAVKSDDLKQAATLLGELAGSDWVQRFKDVISCFERHSKEQGMTLEKLCKYLEPYYGHTGNGEYVAKCELFLDRAKFLGLGELNLDGLDEFWPAFKAASEAALGHSDSAR
ncbi:MAG: hypothetical protein WD063_08460 [Pirellulales bacterium]